MQLIPDDVNVTVCHSSDSKRGSCLCSRLKTFVVLKYFSGFSFMNVLNLNGMLIPQARSEYNVLPYAVGLYRPVPVKSRPIYWAYKSDFAQHVLP
jgi:hypothetical protein